jgi:hypothetical protein
VWAFCFFSVYLNGNVRDVFAVLKGQVETQKTEEAEGNQVIGAEHDPVHNFCNDNCGFVSPLKRGFDFFVTCTHPSGTRALHARVPPEVG